MFRIYTEHNRMDAGTIKDIAKYLEGVNWTSTTYEFIQDCVRESIFNVVGIEEMDSNRQRNAKYKADPNKIRFIWENRIEYKLSEIIMRNNTKKARILYTLYKDSKNIFGSIQQIAQKLEGNDYSPTTIFFLEGFASEDIKILEKIKTDYYRVNKANIVKFWKQNIEWKLSEAINDDESIFGGVL